MRIALCISGLPRCYNYHPKTLLNLFEPYSVDVFMHLWSDHITSSQQQEIQDIWQPKNIIFENQPKNLFEDWYKKTYHLRTAGRPHNNTFPMWYSVYKANELKCQWEKQNKYTYDAVCRARTDLWANSRWTKALEFTKSDQIILPHERHYDQGYNDTIALGNSISMDKYSGMWTWFPIALANNSVFGYEVMLREYLDNWVALAITQIPISIKIMRPHDIYNTYDQVEWGANPPPIDSDLIRYG